MNNLPIKSKEGQKYREKQRCLYLNVGTNAKNVMILCSFLTGNETAIVKIKYKRWLRDLVTKNA